MTPIEKLIKLSDMLFKWNFDHDDNFDAEGVYNGFRITVGIQDVNTWINNNPDDVSQSSMVLSNYLYKKFIEHCKKTGYKL